MERTSSSVLSVKTWRNKGCPPLPSLLELWAHGGLPAISVGLGELMTLQGFIMIICKFFQRYHLSSFSPQAWG